MNIPKHHLELPPEAESVRDFIEALVARYESQIEERKQQVQSLSEQVQSLTERLQKPSPRNSSLPPSSTHPHGKPPRKPSKRPIRKQGGQEGHKRHLRKLVPIEQCKAIIPCVTDRDQAPAPPKPLRFLRYHDVTRDTMRRAPRGMWSASGSLHWAAHGALPPKQAKGF